MENPRRSASLFVVLAFTGGIAACGEEPARPTPTPDGTSTPVTPDHPPHYPSIDLPTSRHAMGPLGPRVTAIDACLRAETARTGAWTPVGYVDYGDRAEGGFCRGVDAPAGCRLRGSQRDDVGDYTGVELESELPNAGSPPKQGFTLNVVHSAARGAWQVHTHFAQSWRDGGESFQVIFTRRSQDRLRDDRFYLAWAASYKIDQTDVVVPEPRAARELLAAISPDAAALRTVALERIDALAAKVFATLDAHAAKGCDYEYRSSIGAVQPAAIPPICHERPLTAQEEDKERAEAVAHFAEQRALIESEAPAMYATLAAVLPLVRCSQ